ncbi:MAG: glutathione S-transferase family protein [Bermanella sp.]
MSKLKLTYFDFNGGRGESVRLALSIGGVPFEDRRVVFKDWPALKASMPFAALPVLEIDGKQVAQSNSINRYVGKLCDLYPSDPYQALLCDEAMDAVEEIVAKISATMFIDEDAKKVQREAIAAGPLTLYLARLQAYLKERGGEFFAAERLTMADLVVSLWVRSLRGGHLDYIAADLTDKVAPLLVQHQVRVAQHPAIVAYYQDH